ncbi:MAG: protein-methionine-S-oxide reductase [Flavobacteriaceae bacterium]|nr:MAG: protein-methionine-S-oxide reductase [Flavobacteriaceae bacterium]
MKLQIKFILFITVCFFSCSNPVMNTTVYKEANNIELDTAWVSKIENTNLFWKSDLTKTQYYIMREKGTERSFSHSYNDNKNRGVYVCAACDNPLYSSVNKFNSGTGWPSFWQAYSSKSILIGLDSSIGMTRNEVVCLRCDGHLGHVFMDGPAPTGVRHCINGGALNFVREQKYAKSVFAQGCFWCVEEIFEAVKGVKTVVSGFAGGMEKSPTYQQVSKGKTTHAEAVEVYYDSDVVSYQDLLKVYFNSGDISQVNGQGNDIGAQYRSVLFYTSEDQKNKIQKYIQKLEATGDYKRGISVEVYKLKKFYKAEKHHQDYVKLHPNQGYVKAVSIPRYNKAVKNFPELLKNNI